MKIELTCGDTLKLNIGSKIIFHSYSGKKELIITGIPRSGIHIKATESGKTGYPHDENTYHINQCSFIDEVGNEICLRCNKPAPEEHVEDKLERIENMTEITTNIINQFVSALSDAAVKTVIKAIVK